MIENKTWGSSELLYDNDGPGILNRFKIFKIIIHPEQYFSAEKHRRRSEHWFCLEGRGLVELDNSHFFLEKDVALNIKASQWHTVKCEGAKPLIAIVIETGTYFGADDVEHAS